MYDVGYSSYSNDMTSIYIYVAQQHLFGKLLDTFHFQEYYVYVARNDDLFVFSL